MNPLPRHKCLRCEHEWIPRSDDPPTVCPKCKSPYWNRPRKTAPKKTDPRVAQVVSHFDVSEKVAVKALETGVSPNIICSTCLKFTATPAKHKGAELCTCDDED